LPGYLYPEEEVEARKADVKVMGNGTVTAGSKYFDNPDFRVDVIIVKRRANIQKVVALTKQEIPQLSNKLIVNKNHTVLGR
jgi:hypothetical protein